jgi:hypothetical protein
MRTGAEVHLRKERKKNERKSSDIQTLISDPIIPGAVGVFQAELILGPEFIGEDVICFVCECQVSERRRGQTCQSFLVFQKAGGTRS